MMRILCLILLVAFSCAKPIGSNSTPPKVVTANLTVPVGISSGAFFAVQYHFSHSSTTKGAGVVAGGPFYCAQDSVDAALFACEKDPSEINLNSLLSAAKACESGGVCDSLSNLAKQKVYLYSGSSDTIVYLGVMQDAAKMYSTLGVPSSNMMEVFHKIPSAHGWVTDNYGNSCSSFGSPYIQNCNYDLSTIMLNYILGNLTAHGESQIEHFYTFSQQEYTPGKVSPASLALGPTGYVYIPPQCISKPGCVVVLAFHGCEMTINDIGTDFVGHSGLNRLAETNRLVVVYPQAIRSELSPSNPEGCWDWWGYTNSNYANAHGPQIEFVWNVAQALASGTLH